MATKKAKNAKGAKTTMTTRAVKKKVEGKKAGGAKPAATAAERRAEAVEALDGLPPEARALAVEAILPALKPEPTAAGESRERAEALLREFGFERTGSEIDETAPAALLEAAEAWRGARTGEGRREAEGALARAGWFRPPGSPASADATPTFEVEHDGKPVRVTVPEDDAKATPPAQNPDLAALQADVVEAKAVLEAAEAEAKRLEDEARTAIAKAKERYRAALAPYRDACKVQGRPCEFEGGTRGANVSERVSFEVEVQGENVRIALKGKPETEEKIPIAEVRAALNKTAYGYTDRYVGPRDVVGNKGGTLSNKLRSVLAG